MRRYYCTGQQVSVYRQTRYELETAEGRTVTLHDTQLAQTILDPLEVWYALPDEPKKYPVLRLIKIFQEKQKTAGFCVFSLTNRGWTASTAYMPKVDKSEGAIMKYMETKRKGELLFRKEADLP